MILETSILSKELKGKARIFEISTSNLLYPSFTYTIEGQTNFNSVGLNLAILAH